MSSAGRVASSSGCGARPRGPGAGLTGYAEQIPHSSPTGSSVMETAEHREPYESRGSRTDLGAPGGESPPGDSTTLAAQRRLEHRQLGVEKAAISRGRSHVAAAFTRRNSGGYSRSHEQCDPGKYD